jgi:hypothetical protein
LDPAKPSGAHSPATTHARNPPPPARSRTPLPLSLYAPTSTFTPTRVACAPVVTQAGSAVTHVQWPEDDSPVHAPEGNNAAAPPLPARPPASRPASVQAVGYRTQSGLYGESRWRRELDFRLDVLLYGVAPAVRNRIALLNGPAAAANAAADVAANTVRFPHDQMFAMGNAWLVACATGSSRLGGAPAHVRTCAVTIQHCVERWLTERLNGHRREQAPFAVVAAIHAPAPPSPLRFRASAAVPDPLLAPHLRDDTSVHGTVVHRADSLRGLLDAGATVHACYSAASLDTMSRAERETYQSTCAAYPNNLIDRRSVLPPVAYFNSCGATYLFGTGPESLSGCFAIRLPQAAQTGQRGSTADLIVASPLDPLFKRVLDDLEREFGLELDPACGGNATRALYDEVEPGQLRSPGWGVTGKGQR